MTEGSNTAGVRTVMVPHTNERTSRNIMPDVSTSEDSNKILKQVSATSQRQQNGTTHPIRSECTRWFLIRLIFSIFHFIFYHILIILTTLTLMIPQFFWNKYSFPSFGRPVRPWTTRRFNPFCNASRSGFGIHPHKLKPTLNCH